MIKFQIVGLPSSAEDKEIIDMVSDFGKVHKFHHLKDIFTSRSKGIAFVEMEGHEARPAMEAINGKLFNGKTVYTRLAREKKRYGR